MFEIKQDRAQRRLLVTAAGFWDDTTFETFARDLLQSASELHALGGETTGLFDASDLAVQSAATMERVAGLFARLGGVMPERVATVVPGALVKLQIDRATAARGEVRRATFGSRAEAIAWLDNPS